MKGVSKKQLCLNDKLEDHINTLTEFIDEVKSIVEDETYGMDRNDELVILILFPPVNIDIQEQAMETGTAEFDNVVHGFETLYMDFSKITLAEVYNFEHVAMTEIQICENALAYQETKQKRKEKECNAIL